MKCPTLPVSTEWRLQQVTRKLRDWGLSFTAKDTPKRALHAQHLAWWQHFQAQFLEQLKAVRKARHAQAAELKRQKYLLSINPNL